jgi:hypothetical protein
MKQLAERRDLRRKEKDPTVPDGPAQRVKCGLIFSTP